MIIGGNHGQVVFLLLNGRMLAYLHHVRRNRETDALSNRQQLVRMITGPYVNVKGCFSHFHAMHEACGLLVVLLWPPTLILTLFTLLQWTALPNHLQNLSLRKHCFPALALHRTVQIVRDSGAEHKAPLHPFNV